MRSYLIKLHASVSAKSLTAPLESPGRTHKFSSQDSGREHRSRLHPPNEKPFQRTMTEGSKKRKRDGEASGKPKKKVVLDAPPSTATVSSVLRPKLGPPVIGKAGHWFVVVTVR